MKKYLVFFINYNNNISQINPAPIPIKIIGVGGELNSYEHFLEMIKYNSDNFVF